MLSIINKVIGVLSILVIFAFIIAFPVWVLWNWLVPTIFGLPSIDMFQAFGLVLLVKILFTSSNSSDKSFDKK